MDAGRLSPSEDDVSIRLHAMIATCTNMHVQDDSGSLTSDSGDLELGGEPSGEGLEDEEQDEQFGSDNDF